VPTIGASAWPNKSIRHLPTKKTDLGSSQRRIEAARMGDHAGASCGKASHAARRKCSGIKGL
jgi:hypothetical protein